MNPLTKPMTPAAPWHAATLAGYARSEWNAEPLWLLAQRWDSARRATARLRRRTEPVAIPRNARGLQPLALFG